MIQIFALSAQTYAPSLTRPPEEVGCKAAGGNEMERVQRNIAAGKSKFRSIFIFISECRNIYRMYKKMYIYVWPIAGPNDPDDSCMRSGGNSGRVRASTGKQGITHGDERWSEGEQAVFRQRRWVWEVQRRLHVRTEVDGVGGKNIGWVGKAREEFRRARKRVCRAWATERRANQKGRWQW